MTDLSLSCKNCKQNSSLAPNEGNWKYLGGKVYGCLCCGYLTKSGIFTNTLMTKEETLDYLNKSKDVIWDDKNFSIFFNAIGFFPPIYDSLKEMQGLICVNYGYISSFIFEKTLRSMSGLSQMLEENMLLELRDKISNSSIITMNFWYCFNIYSLCRLLSNKIGKDNVLPFFRELVKCSLEYSYNFYENKYKEWHLPSQNREAYLSLSSLSLNALSNELDKFEYLLAPDETTYTATHAFAEMIIRNVASPSENIIVKHIVMSTVSLFEDKEFNFIFNSVLANLQLRL